MQNSLLTLDSVCFHDRQTGKSILQNISLQLDFAQILTIIGPNGGGKTTLLKLMLGLAVPTSGVIQVRKNLRIGYMPQRLKINPFLPLTVKRLLELSALDTQSEIDSVLQEVQISTLKKQDVLTLSGGEWQRVLLARALLRKPELLVLDEPAQGVDVVGQNEFYQLLGNLRTERHCGIILVSHDLHLVMTASDQVLCLNGHVCCAGHPESVVQDPCYRNLFGLPALSPYVHHHGHSHS